jgi:hypothetical protein
VDIKQITELIQVLVSLINAISWPLVVVFIVVFLGKPIKKILSDVSELSLKAGGFEAQAKTKEIEAAASLGAAIAKQEQESKSDYQTSVENESLKIVGLVNRVFQPRVIRRLTNRKILWVDVVVYLNFLVRSVTKAIAINSFNRLQRKH